jgi:hypothetical protein
MNEGGDKLVTNVGSDSAILSKTKRSRGRKKQGPFLKVKAGSAVVPIYQTESKGRVRYTLSFYRDGRRERKVFNSLEDAKKEALFVAQRIQVGMQHVTDLKPHERDSFKAAEAMLQKSGIPLVAAVEDYLRARDLAGTESLAAMASEYGQHFKKVVRKVTIPEIVAEIRQRRRREEALRRMPELMRKAEEELDSGNWRHAAVSHGEFSLLFDAHDPTGNATQMTGRSNSMSAQLAKHRAEAERVGRVNQLVAEMSLIADEAENRAVTPLGLTLDFAGPLLENLVRMWRQIEELRGEIPAGPRSRIDSTRAQLSQTIERGRSARRARMIATTAAAILVLLAAAGIGLLAFRASGHAKALADFQSKKSTSALSDLLQRVTFRADTQPVRRSPGSGSVPDSKYGRAWNEGWSSGRRL